ncbi:MAG: HPP family protein [Deltaproteobacteria bacterium]|nr:HPP family protein [Deltaproteobacteria bacterium]
MEEIPGYLDITPEDFRALYQVAHDHACRRLRGPAAEAGAALPAAAVVHPGLGEIAWSWLGAFLGIAAVALLQAAWFEGSDRVMLIASFGASAVLVYGAVRSPLAQPRNVLGGHVLSALVGVLAFRTLGGLPWLAGAVAVATAIAVMLATRTLHPPGGATALIAVIGGDKIHRLGFAYALVPAAAGALVMLAVALVVNNLPASRRYPEYWA